MGSFLSGDKFTASRRSRRREFIIAYPATDYHWNVKKIGCMKKTACKTQTAFVAV